MSIMLYEEVIQLHKNLVFNFFKHGGWNKAMEAGFFLLKLISTVSVSIRELRVYAPFKKAVHYIYPLNIHLKKL